MALQCYSAQWLARAIWEGLKPALRVEGLWPP